MSWRSLGVVFLTMQAVGGAAWWALLLGWPASRAAFRASEAPDVTLLAFGAADGLLYAGLSAACARGLARRRRWAWPALLVHAGAASYAALYCWTLTALTGGDGWAGAVLMTPSLLVPGVLAWKLRPGETE